MVVEESKPQFGNKGHKWCQWVAAKKRFVIKFNYYEGKSRIFLYTHVTKSGAYGSLILVRTIHALFGLPGKLR